MTTRKSLLWIAGLVIAASLAIAPASWAVPEGTTEIKGEVGGALYALYLPEGWNGDLVLYAHGYNARQDPLRLPDPEVPHPWYGTAALLRDALLDHGFAIAMSSYSTNGWAVEEGFFETRHLLPLFTSTFARPSRVFVMGHSMGGLITVRLAEKHPGLFDGALPMCAVLAGADLELDYVLHVRALFDYFYPGVLPGDALHVPDPYTADDVFFTALGAMLADPRPLPGWVELGLIDGLELPLDPADSLFWIAVRLWAQGGLDSMERTNGESPWGNLDTYYTGSFDDLTLNSLVDRYEERPAGGAYFRRWYEPTGKIRTPTLALHNSVDGLVPYVQTADYVAKVAGQGYSENLVLRTIDRHGHCAFTVEEELQAFLDLVEWVETGVKPSP